MSYTVRFVVVDEDVYAPDVEGAKCTLDRGVKYTVGGIVDFFGIAVGDHSYSVEKEGMQFVSGKAPFMGSIPQSGTLTISPHWPPESLFAVEFTFRKVSAGEFRFDAWNPPLDAREVFIVGASWPAEVRIVDVGEDVYAHCVVKNIGTTAGKSTITVKDLDTGIVVTTWSIPELAPNERFKTSSSGAYVGKMPGKDWRLEFKVEP